MGMAYRKKMTKEAKWNQWRNYYRGNWKPGILPVNLFFTMLRTTVPRIYFNNPSLSIQSTRPGVEFAAMAQLIERIDNKLIRTMKMKRQMKSMIQHAWMFGTAVGAIGFGEQYYPTPTEGEDSSGPVDKYGERVEYNDTIKDNMPWFLATHPGKFIVPSGLATFGDARWCATWISRPLWDVQHDPRFKNVKNLKPSKPIGIQIAGGSEALNPDMIDLVLIRDKKTKKAFMFAPYSGDDRPIMIAEDSLQINGRMGNYPLVFNEDDECFWGVPDSVILEPHQTEMNEIRTLQMKHRRMSIIKAFAVRNALKAEEIEKMTDEEVLSVILIDGNLSDIKFQDVAHEPPMLAQAGQEVRDDVRESMGFSRNQAGNYSQGPQGGGSRASAQEANIVNQAANIRVDERRDMMADVLCDVFEDINDVCWQHWNTEQVEAIMGPQGTPVWVAFKPAMLKGAEYALSIDPDSTQPETKDMRMQKAVNFYGIAKDNPLVDPEKLTKYLFREFHGVQFDDMMRSLNAMRPGQAGGTPDQPMGMEQYMGQMAQQKPTGG